MKVIVTVMTRRGHKRNQVRNRDKEHRNRSLNSRPQC